MAGVVLTMILLPGLGGQRRSPQCRAEMDPLRAQQLAAELEVEMMADMYNR